MIRVLIVDDSRTICSALRRGLMMDPEIDVVATAHDAEEARAALEAYEPDVMTLDLTMPRTSGLEFLRWVIPNHPLPVVVVSHLARPGSQEAVDALALGAVDVVCKSLDGGRSALMRTLRRKIHAAARVRTELLAPVALEPQPSHADAPLDTCVDLVALGASTGGLDAIYRIASQLPADGPAVVVTQHLPAVFTRHFAERLDTYCEVRVREGYTGATLERGTLFIAPGGRQMRVTRRGPRMVLDCDATEEVNHHAPSVDALFESAARVAGGRAVGVLLTGMGDDGAKGLLALRQAGATTIAQDEESSVVYGMPKAAADLGAAEQVLPLDDISEAIARLTERPASARSA